MPATSRVGRKPVTIPAGVDIKIDDQVMIIKGPKGHLNLALHPYVRVMMEQGNIKIMQNPEGTYCRSGSGAKLLNAIPGTTRSEIYNAVWGVSQGFQRKLTLVGVGYRAQVKEGVLSLTVGFSHPVEFVVPEGITIEAPTLTEVLVKGADKHRVGHVASMIRAIRPPEPYKGKGIRYANEKIVQKETKKK
jgi:large subunit ribosomal protein L6